MSQSSNLPTNPSPIGQLANAAAASAAFSLYQQEISQRTIDNQRQSLALFERWEHRALTPLRTFGRVPMFYYVAHLYLLHGLGLALAWLAGHRWAAFDFQARITGMPAAFSFPLWGVYVFSAVTITLLYPLCRRYDQWRRGSQSLIARYL